MTLEELRKRAGVTTREAAAALGIKVPSYWRKENGKRKLSPREIVVLAELYRVSIEDIVLSCRHFADAANDELAEVKPSA